MKLYSQEWYELMEDFEHIAKTMNISIRLDKEEKNMWKKQVYYQQGEANALFIAFLQGYQLAKAKARVNDLPLDE